MSASPGVVPRQALTGSWSELARRLFETSSQFTTSIDRTFGALSDALGLGPARRMQAVWQELWLAGIAQQEASATYALLVQAAMAQGVQRLITRLAEKADSGERIDSVVTLLRLWGVCTEEAVHETLQSAPGLDATAALTRSGMALRNRSRDAASIVADLLDVATRRELDDAYRDIQTLKRELRALRAGRAPRASARVIGREQGSRVEARRAVNTPAEGTSR